MTTNPLRSRHRNGAAIVAHLGIVSALAFSAPRANACSVCIAHALGAGLHGLGAQTLKKGKSVVSFSFLTTGKTQDGEDPGTLERETQCEYGVGYQYGISNTLTFRADIPYIVRSIKTTGQPEENASGLGDSSLGLFYQVPSSVHSSFLTAFYADIKIPTGNNSRRDSAGDLREQHLQPGTGSTDLAVGAAFTGEINTRGELWFAGMHARIDGNNRRGYHYGNALFYNVGYSRPLTPLNSLVLELNGRFADRDVTEVGTHDPDSGGHVGYLAVSYRRSLAGSVGFIATYQHPIMKNLNGSQREGAIFSASLTLGL